MESVISKLDGTLVDVELTTKLGDVYRFPAVDVEALSAVLPKNSDRIPAGTPTLAIINASFAVLSIPFQVLSTITVEGEPWWACPASTVSEK
jgi:hypothetical protein